MYILQLLDKVKFSAAHFLTNHEKCSRLHGHNYSVSVFLGANTLHQNGYVMDFYEVKQMLESIVMPMDHKLLIPQYASDVNVKNVSRDGPIPHNNDHIYFNDKEYVIPHEDVYYLQVSATTAEQIARYICIELVSLIKKDHANITEISVKVAETDGNLGDYAIKIRED